MKIRNAQVGDATDLSRLFVQLGYDCAASDLVDRIGTSVDWPLDEILVAEDVQSVVGALVLNVITPLYEPGKWGVISSLIVDESVRSKQIGAALLAHAEQCARNSARGTGDAPRSSCPAVNPERKPMPSMNEMAMRK
jgi:N-acetylglutamate synthase-like GNAT family acetyltransferase